ncbi:MAG: hypothetical protein IJY01_04575 [Clostridia bacterium]|nr:hypothetical protein [Clostridia bacterium]
MKKILKGLLLIILSLACVLSLLACTGGGEPDDTDEPSEPTYPEDDIPLEGLVLIRKNVAQFKVVIASGAGSEGRRAAGELVDRLRALDIEIADAVEDKNAAEISECEIIIGVGAKNRDGCAVQASELGDMGYLIKAVGGRIVIAGGTPTLTRKTVKDFIEDQLGITENTVSRRNVAVPKDLNIFVPTDYNIDKITVAGNDLAGYVIACDENDEAVYPDLVNKVKNKIFSASGYNLSIVDNRNVASGAKQIIVRTVEDAGEGGFRVLVDGSNLVIEASLSTMFASAVDEFLSASLNGTKALLAFGSDYTYTKNILTVKYADFGAKGDGKNNDFFALLEAHETVNLTKQTLIPEGEVGNNFYIGKTWIDGEDTAKSIPVRTDMDFGDATIIIDDTVDGIHKAGYRSGAIFTVGRDHGIITYRSEEDYPRQISSLTDDPRLKVGDTYIPWLAEVLEAEKNMVFLRNENHKDYVRFGGNQNEGNDRTDVIIVDSEGNISADTPIIFDFDELTQLQILPITDEPIIVQGGFFKTRAATCAPEHASLSHTPYESYSRGIAVTRPNATIKNIDHEVTGEPSSKGYPCSGFITISATYNVTLSDTKLSGRKMYYEKKATSSSPVPMGSYDLTMNSSVNTYYKNLTQYRDIKDEVYWGLSASNGCKNLYFDNVVISRIDAHCGLWNIDVKNSTIGFAFNVIGGGTLNATNVQRRTGAEFINLRGDYGATFNGTVNLKNCRMNGYATYKSLDSSGNRVEFNYNSYVSRVYVINSGFNASSYNSATDKYYAEWDFGYKCYMPTQVILDNFTAGHQEGIQGAVAKTHTVHVFNDISNSAFNSSAPHGGYQICKKVTYKNMTKPTICPTPGTCTKLAGISIVQG